jgi:hypothetical protein
LFNAESPTLNNLCALDKGGRTRWTRGEVRPFPAATDVSGGAQDFGGYHTCVFRVLCRKEVLTRSSPRCPRTKAVVRQLRKTGTHHGGTNVRKLLSRFVVIAAVLVTAPLVGDAARAAAPAGQQSVQYKNGPQADFEQQARAAGLTPSQAEYLEKRSDYYLATMGGKRISLNQIDVNGTATVNIALPSESRPRNFASEAGLRQAAQPCPYLYFCAYQYEHWTGDSIDMYNCRFYSIPWVSVGSWENDQTVGTKPMQYHTNIGSQRLPAAYALRGSGVTWATITGIRPCD